MKERPILFSAPMVRAILEGRKTQTRRIVKGMALEWLAPGMFIPTYIADPANHMCPYGDPGDRLWVREAFSGPHCMEASEGCAAVPPAKWARSSRIWYWADGNPGHGDWTRPRPSIHMPRWASRITLEITGVRVERLQDISEADAIAEGLIRDGDGWRGAPDLPWFASPVAAYRSLWESINGINSWDANPWVWVIEFKRVEREAAAA